MLLFSLTLVSILFPIIVMAAAKKKKKSNKKSSSGNNKTTPTNGASSSLNDDGKNDDDGYVRRKFPLRKFRRFPSYSKEDFVAFCRRRWEATLFTDTNNDDTTGARCSEKEETSTRSNGTVSVSRESISDVLYSMSRAYKIDRLGARLALDLATGKQTEARKVFEALKTSSSSSTEKKKNDDEDDDEDEEEEQTMFERVFGDGCKKVPKSNDVAFRAPLEALREALDVVDTLEEKKKKRKKKNGEDTDGSKNRGNEEGESYASSEYDSDEYDSDDETEYSTEDFQSSEASSLLSIGERARGGGKGTRENNDSEKSASTQQEQTTTSSKSLFRDVVFAAYHIFALNDAKKQAFDKWISDDVNRLYAKDLLLSEKEVKDDEKKPCAATRAEFLRVACASRASNAEKVALETLETQFPRWQIQIQRAKRRRDVSSRIANERWVRLLQTHASEIRQKVEESPEDADFALAWKKMREFTRKFDVTEAQQNAYAATDPIAQKESARVADACRAMLLDGLNAACGVSISNLSIVEDDSQYYNSDVFEKQRLLIAKECGRPLRSLEARCAQARKEIGTLTSRAFAAAPIVSTAAVACVFQNLSSQYELHKKEQIQNELLEEESVEREASIERERLKKQAKLERARELARRKLEKENERKRAEEELLLRKREDERLQNLAIEEQRLERARVEARRKEREIEEQKLLLEEIERINRANKSWADYASDSEEDDLSDLRAFVDKVNMNSSS